MTNPPSDPLQVRTIRWLRHRRGRFFLGLGLLGLALWLSQYEDHHTVAVQLPETGVELIYSRVETDLIGYSDYRAFAITDRIPLTRIHENIGGADYFCIAEGRDITTGRPYVRASDIWGIVWFDLDEQCLWNTTKPTQVDPPERVCTILHPMDVAWRQLGKITDASWYEPRFEPGTFEECTDESVKQHR